MFSVLFSNLGKLNNKLFEDLASRGEFFDWCAWLQKVLGEILWFIFDLLENNCTDSLGIDHQGQFESSSPLLIIMQAEINDSIPKFWELFTQSRGSLRISVNPENFTTSWIEKKFCFSSFPCFFTLEIFVILKKKRN